VGEIGGAGKTVQKTRNGNDEEQQASANASVVANARRVAGQENRKADQHNRKHVTEATEEQAEGVGIENLGYTILGEEPHRDNAANTKQEKQERNAVATIFARDFLFT